MKTILTVGAIFTLCLASMPSTKAESDSQKEAAVVLSYSRGTMAKKLRLDEIPVGEAITILGVACSRQYTDVAIAGLDSPNSDIPMFAADFASKLTKARQVEFLRATLGKDSLWENLSWNEGPQINFEANVLALIRGFLGEDFPKLDFTNKSERLKTAELLKMLDLSLYAKAAAALSHETMLAKVQLAETPPGEAVEIIEAASAKQDADVLIAGLNSANLDLRWASIASAARLSKSKQLQLLRSGLNNDSLWPKPNYALMNEAAQLSLENELLSRVQGLLGDNFPTSDFRDPNVRKRILDQLNTAPDP